MARKAYLTNLIAKCGKEQDNVRKVLLQMKEEKTSHQLMTEMLECYRILRRSMKVSKQL